MLRADVSDASMLLKSFSYKIQQYTNQFIGNLVGWIVIFTIICLKFVNVRKVQVAILSRLPRDMYQTDRILPMYIQSRVRVSFRPRFFVYAKTTQTRVARSLTVQRHRPPERRNNSKGLHARWRYTSQFLA